MASNPSAPASSAQVKRTSVSGHAGNNASILLEKSKAGIRRSTPDSEAMASSDDEQDQHFHQAHLVMNQHAPKTARRASWLSDLHQVPQRKVSSNGSMTFSPATTSYSPTTVIDQNSRTPSATSSVAPTLGRIHSSSTSFPWGSTIWNGDAQKGPPSRLTEVLPSPTSMVTPSTTIFRGDDPLTSPTIIRDTPSDSAIPFAIPLHPTPKTYRSQSYSVGQLDPDTVSAFPRGSMMQPASTNTNGRPRTGSSFVGLQHRPSRPSMLGDLSHDPSILGQLREVDDDDESSTGSEAGVHLSDTQARTIEQLAMENALLRKAAAKQQHMTRLKDSGFLINRTSNLDSIKPNDRTLHNYTEDGADDQQEYDLNDIDPLNAGQAFDQNFTSTRRFSEFHANSGNHLSMTGTAENRKIESVKKGHWQSSLGFGGLSELPQSRRHSLADIPTRHGSISSVGEPQQNLAGVHDGNGSSDDSRGFGVARPPQGDNGEYIHFRLRQQLEEKSLEFRHLHDRHFAASYFSNMDPSIRSPELYRPSDSPTSMQQAYTIHTYNRPQHLGHSQPHPGQLLCMVTFKACRAEVYYVQEGTGLHVKTGDLVIVEADRGTDLGTVAQTEITWPMAKELKEHYVEEHYKWLMMFSRHGQSGNSTTSNPTGPASSAISAQTSAIGGMGPPGQIPNQDPQSVELKPKMVKRLAQAHEIQTLRDKEGNEAKAKRVCQQKVIEHRLNMEILDAEFQM